MDLAIVHDRERGGVDEILSLPRRNRLPGISLARDVEVDAVGPQLRRLLHA
jgi:hypothetical protein